MAENLVRKWNCQAFVLPVTLWSAALAKLRSSAGVEILGVEKFYHGRSRMVIRITGKENQGRNNGYGSRTTATGRMAKSKIQTQAGKSH
jgi:hypothetical protein